MLEMYEIMWLSNMTFKKLQQLCWQLDDVIVGCIQLGYSKYSLFIHTNVSLSE